MSSRREFITLLGGAAAWPTVARAQQKPDKIRQIGMLMGFAQDDPIAQSMVAAFRGALLKLGWMEGSNIRVELRWAGPDIERTNRLAKELAELRPDVLLGQTTPVVRALAREVPTTPMVFVTVSDPIGSGFAASLAHPGGNITGFTVDDSALGGKWVELLKQIAPATTRVALLFNPAGPPLEFFLPSIQAAASSLNVQANLVTIHGRDEIEGVIAAQARDPGGRHCRASERFQHHQSRANHRAGGAIPRSGDLFFRLLCAIGWADRLWQRLCRTVATSGRIYRPHPQGY
jgi:putative tryptophan/tyrosine transport system substrate-binding protein